MKSNTLLALLTAVFIHHSSPFIFGQGSLTPPGAPAPTMKSLDQIEARTPISAAPFTISASGSYYLTGNLSVSTGDAIIINASGVSLDLKGFSITSTSATASGAGIHIVQPNSDITIQNGHILGGYIYNGTSIASGPGLMTGISLTGTANTLENTRVTDVSVSGLYLGIGNLGNGSIIQRCTACVTATLGLGAALVVDSEAHNCGSTAISGNVVANSRGAGVLGGTGIISTTVTNSLGLSDTGTGIMANSVTGSYASGTGGTTRLLFPFVSNAAGFDTGIVISNTGVDSTGTVGSSGTAVFHFYGNPATANITTPVINAGTVYTTDLAVLLPGFQGYIEVDCNFPLGHGFGYLGSGIGTSSATSSAIPVLVLPAHRSNAQPEGLGQ